MNWTLENLSIRQITWGDDKGKFAGSVTFTNKTGDKFSITLDNERTSQYLALVSADVVKSANELSEKIKDSLPLPTKKTTSSNGA